MQNFFFLFALLSALLVVWMLVESASIRYKSDIQILTPDIKIPTAEGQGQYGTARFLTEKEYKRYWTLLTMDEKSPRFHQERKEEIK